MTNTGNLAVGRIDEFGVHRHPDMGVRPRGRRNSERGECHEEYAERSSHREHHSTDCGAKVTRNSVTKPGCISDLRLARGIQVPAAPPSARGSWPPSRLRSGCITTAPEWPIVSEYDSSRTATSWPAEIRRSMRLPLKRDSIRKFVWAEPHVRPSTQRGASSALSSGWPNVT